MLYLRKYVLSVMVEPSSLVLRNKTHHFSLAHDPSYKSNLLESGTKEGILALHVSLHARKTLNRKPNVFNVIVLSLDLGKYITYSNLILT